jgi:3-oxoacyl-[acyl-carrier protein] reductase
MDLQLKDKKVFIAGSSRGLGYAAARGLGLEGARLTINSRHPESLSQAAEALTKECGVDVYTAAGDVSEPSAAGKLISQAVEMLGGLDLLITNSGGPPSGKFETFDDSDWLTAVDLVFLSHVRLIRAALPYLRNSDAASVLTITSMSVKQPISNLVLSNSIRAATVGLTKSLALELGGDGIRFNSILPGWTQTERVHQLMADRAEINDSDIDDEFKKQALESPFERMATTEEFANPAVFLLSPAASYLTGVMLTVDGGMIKGIF